MRYLRGIDAKVEKLGVDMREVKQRLGAFGDGLALASKLLTSLSHRIDRIDVRLERVERRLDLVEV